MHGNADVKFGNESVFDLARGSSTNDELLNICMIRSGFKKFEEEKEIQNTDGFFIADTSVYIKLGNRLGYLTKDRLLASKSVYNELSERTKLTQMGKEIIVFYLGMYSYRHLHKSPPVSEYNKSGDIPLIEETRKIKENIPEKVTLITADRQLKQRARTLGVNVIFLNTLKSDSGNMSELLLCASNRREYMEKYDYARRDLTITINDKEVIKIESDPTKEGFSRIKTLNKEFNYAKLIEKLYEMI
ncbi:PIN domain-containing protein [Saccharolobus solfataricus]|uniref:PIN domain-containing protein n=2 Tax=Saccharolobus solfataricus TaxID=2287 RepID=Q97YB9_SACS2|nr:PIN domain-containing protein [Saccharolobus solfataricus]AAK41644.1 Hypothetical protein SSO1409 [Saccharolobus solfataricus P2]SAI85086.1 uncharacterised protein [Saccharolobus solfataricus]